jgi:GT2 family glycosyltransferase
VPLVTVCIPAYRTGPKIAATLQSVQDQSLTDFRCVIAFDPPAADQMNFVAPFLEDARFYCRENSTRLGWDGNVRALMADVETPLFMVLPHDDLINPVYLETLAAAMTANPSLAAAYTDMWRFGGKAFPSITTMDLSEKASLVDRVMAFLLQRAEAVPLRGMTRSSILRDYSFSLDRSGGFAVECEWTLRLLLCGPLRHVPRPYYYKRHSAVGTTTATQRWGCLTLDTLITAWNDHRTRMLAMVHEIGDAGPAQMHLLEAAAEAALLYRLIQAASVNREPAAVRETVQTHIDRANSLISDHLRYADTIKFLPAKIDAVRMMANARWAIWHKDWKEALRLSTEATSNDPGNVEALFTRARVLIRLKQHKEALEPLLSVMSLAPHKERLVELMRTISNGALAEKPANDSNSDREISALKAKIDKLVEMAAATQNELARKDAELASTSEALAQKHKTLTDLAHRIDQMTSSTSWRVTAPLRSAVQLLRTGRRRP